MNVTIDRYAYAFIGPSEQGAVTFQSIDTGEEEHFDPASDTIPVDGPLRLLKGVYARVVREFLKGQQVPLRISVCSDAPPGSGLGSSSTMVVALVQAFAEHFSLALGEYEVARLAYEIERQDLGLAGGKQDQYAATFGGFNFMEFQAQDRVIVNPLRVKEWVWSELESSLLLYFTGISRESAGIIEQQSRGVGEKNEASISAMHRLKHEAVQMKECVLKGDIAGLAKTLQTGWDAKKKTATSVSNAHIEEVEAVAFANGARAAKVSGAGGGGFMMFMCEPQDRVRLRRALIKCGGRLVDFHFTQQGAMAWRVG